MKFRLTAYHLLFWLTYILYQAISYGWENTDQLTFKLTPVIISPTLPVIIIISYTNLYVLMPALYYHEKYLRYVISLVSLLFFSGVFIRLFTHLIVLPWEQVNNPARYAMENKQFWIPIRILRLSIESCPLIAISMVIELMRKAYERQKTLRELEQEKHAVEMGLLKAQINPHFFFNTLNTLYGLILKNSDKAGQFALRLSDLMHYMLYETNAEKVLLKKEIDHIENYISVEQLRFADRLDLSFQYSGDIGAKLIEPLILLPFVENSFKHGIANDSGWITISIKVIGRRLFMKVENSFSEFADKNNHGLGLENVRRRLALRYPKNHDLQLTSNADFFEVELKINL